MTCEKENELAEVKMLAGMLYDKEQGAFKSIRRRRIDLDNQRRHLQKKADEACADAQTGVTDMPVLLAYLDSLAARVTRLHEQDAALLAEENAQKEHLKTALGRQIRLEESPDE